MQGVWELTKYFWHLQQILIVWKQYEGDFIHVFN